MTEERAKQLIKALAQILTDLGLGDVFLTTTKAQGYNPGGIWTGLGESGICNYWEDPAHDLIPQEIKDWLEKEDLFLEWQNPGVVCIWPI